MNWYYEHGGNRIGPVGSDEINKLNVNGTINASTLVWNDTFGSAWKRLDETELAADKKSGPPPLPTAHVNDTYAWLLTLLPIIGLVGEKILAESGSTNQPPDAFIFFAYFIANAGLALADSQKINNAGLNPEGKTLGGWFWLVPAYLYKRASLLGQTQIKLLIWLAGFFGSLYIQNPEILKGNVYFGVGVPACDSGTSSSQIKKLFGEIPLMKNNSLIAINATKFTELDHSDSMRKCSATINANNGRNYQAKYTISKQDSNFYYYLELE